MIDELIPKKTKPDKGSKGAAGVDYLDVPAAEQTQQAEPPEIRQAAQQAAKQAEPLIPQVRQTAQQIAPQVRQAAQQLQNDPSVQQIVQENPQLNEPIIIMPSSVRSVKASSGRSNSYGAGYSGGNGSGPLIYNP